MTRFYRRASLRNLSIPSLAFLASLLGVVNCAPEPGVSSEEPISQAQEALVSCPTTVDPLHTGEIVHPNVVDDVTRAGVAGIGPWTLGGLIRKMAPTASQADSDRFLRGVLESWRTDQVVNGETLPARASGVDGNIIQQFMVPNSNPRSFDLTKMPFELMAIANRLDLRSSADAGELRFVFGLTNPPSARQFGFPRFQFMTLIVEYRVPFVAGLETAAKWAEKWHELDAIDPAVQAALFNTKLQAITDIVTARNAFPAGQNGSAVMRIRTNEIQLGSPWEMREFNFASTGFMVPATTKNSPNHDLLSNSPALLDYLNQNPVLGSTTDTAFMALNMPTLFEGGSFLGGKAQENFDSSRWTLPNGENQVNSVRIDNLGLLTCNGCHNENKASNDIAFYQVDPLASPNNPSTGVNDGTGRLSKFMTLGDPSKGGRRPAELTRRATDMGTLLYQPNGVDLVVSKVSWSPANPAPGQATTFSATITNYGKTTKAAGTINGVAFRVDGNLTTWSDTNTAALAPGQSITVTSNSGPSGSATWNATSGAHTIEAWVDDVNRIGEINENNNKLTAPLVSGIDLTVTNILWSPVSPSPGTPVTFSATVKNEGSVATPAGTIVGVRFEIDGQLVTWSDNSTASLAPGASRTVTANSGPSGSATWVTNGATHRVAAWVDDVNRIVDVNRNNNKVQTKFF